MTTHETTMTHNETTMTNHETTMATGNGYGSDGGRLVDLRHGDPWGPMETHGGPWEPMIPHGGPWVPMGTHGVPRKHFLFSVFIIHGFSMDFPWNFPWIFHGISMDFPCDFPWIDFPWIFHELQNVSVVVAGTSPGVRKQSRHPHIVRVRGT